MTHNDIIPEYRNKEIDNVFDTVSFLSHTQIFMGLNFCENNLLRNYIIR